MISFIKKHKSHQEGKGRQGSLKSSHSLIRMHKNISEKEVLSWTLAVKFKMQMNVYEEGHSRPMWSQRPAQVQDGWARTSYEATKSSTFSAN